MTQNTSDPFIVISHTPSGRECCLKDMTQSLPKAELEQLMDQLLEQKLFGFNMLSDTSGTMSLDKPRLTHIQIGEQLYRLLLFPYEAQIETF